MLNYSGIVISLPISVSVGHPIPSDISEDIVDKTKVLIINTIRALGIRDTIFNVYIMIVDEESNLLEMGVRMRPTYLSENTSIYSRFDAYEYLINLALGL